MTRTQRETLVERYLAGEMNMADEQEFFMNVATDGELFQTLRAHRMVDRAISRDRDALPDHHVEVRAHALALLVGESSPVPTPSESVGTGFFGSGFAPWITFLSIGVVFSVAGFVTHTLMQSQSPAPMTASRMQPAQEKLREQLPNRSVLPDSLSTNEKIRQTSNKQVVRGDVGTSIPEIPVVVNPAPRPSERVSRLANSDSGTERARYDSNSASRPKLSAERSHDTVQSVSSQSVEPALLPHGRDSVSFHAKISLPELGGQKP
jgi:hypothetical protein